MSRSAVIEILQKIDALPQKDRLRLERELAARADKEWKNQARQARAQARQGGIDQAMIDRAVEQTRYGPAMKILFDTNVYIAEALLGRGAERMIAATSAARWRIYSSTYILDEL